MGRTLLLDRCINVADFEGSTGVIIGSRLPSYLLAVYIAPTAPSEEEEGQPGQLDVAWMVEHATQVLKMLPGGQHVLGFAVRSAGDAFSQKSKINKLLTSLRSLEPELDELVILQVGEQLTAKSSVEGAELKAVICRSAEADLDFVELDSHVILDLPIALTCSEKSDQMLITQVEKGVEKFGKSLRNCLCLFDNQLRGDEELIAPAQLEAPDKKGKGRQSERKGVSVLEEDMDESKERLKVKVQLLLKDEGACQDDVAVRDSNIRIKLAGKLTTRAFVPYGTTIRECRQAIITDILRSLGGRVRMHCDSLVGEEVEGGAAAGPIVHEPPRRVFVALPGSAGVAVSDYLYPGEGTEDSMPAIQEIFGFTPTEDEIEDDLEIVAAPKDVGRDPDVGRGGKKFGVGGGGLGQLLTLTSVQLGLGLVISLLGVLLARWLSARNTAADQAQHQE